MLRPCVPWTPEEETALQRGVELYGEGSWQTILERKHFKKERTVVDLKDKWRNLQKKKVDAPMED